MCPLEFAGPEVIEILAFADLCENGLPPVAGGALDQAQSFLEVCRFAWAEIARNKSELGIIF